MDASSADVIGSAASAAASVDAVDVVDVVDDSSDSMPPTKRLRLTDDCDGDGDKVKDEYHYDEEGRLHRDDDLPAIEKASGFRAWFRHGVPWRKDPTLPHEIDQYGTMMWRDADNLLHRDDDLPAYVTKTGQMKWIRHGKYWRADPNKPHRIINVICEHQWLETDVSVEHAQLHRDNDLPALIQYNPSGTIKLQNWFRRGEPWRPDPALPHGVNAESTMIWYDADKKLHRDDDNPAVVYSNGTMTWFQHGVPGRSDPTKPHMIDAKLTKKWLDADRLLHSHGDRPAVIFEDGTKRWYLHGVPGREDPSKPFLEHSNGDVWWVDADNKAHREFGLPAGIVNGKHQYFHHGTRLVPPKDAWTPHTVTIFPASDTDTCCICFEPFTEPLTRAVICHSAAAHSMHRKCMDSFRIAVNKMEGATARKCPMCRGPLTTNVVVL
jgi:hypothetical protein